MQKRQRTVKIIRSLLVSLVIAALVVPQAAFADSGASSEQAEAVHQEETDGADTKEDANTKDDAETKEDVIWEAADLLYFVSVLMYKEGVTWQDVYNELDKRHKAK